MKRSIGLLEMKNITKGILVADVMLKSANVELIMAQPLCPGKYVVMVAGDVGAVQNAVSSGKAAGDPKNVVDDLVLSNIHSGVLEALSPGTNAKTIKSLGIIESRSIASAVLAADVAAKSAAVDLLKIRMARFMGGKAVVFLSGETGSVTAAVRAGSNSIQEKGFLIDQLVISSPHQDVSKTVF